MAVPTYLTTRYAEREKVKALGARWDAARKQWFVPEGMDLAPFQPWLPQGAAAAVAVAAVAEGVAPLAAASTEGASLPSISPPQGIGLSALLAAVGYTVGQAFPEGVWTRVEVVDARLRNGHVYLEVAERSGDGDLLAKAHAMVWERTAARILPPFEAATGVKIGPGIKVLVRLRPVFKAQYGFSLELDAIDSDYTLGDLEARKREIRTQLQREGLWDANRRLEAPWDYRVVLVVAPPNAAGLGDFQVEADRLSRAQVCEFVYHHCRFQGEGAAAEIRETLQAALAEWQARHGLWPDAVVLIRGGGAVNDLAWLNDYALARAVCECPVPVHTGIGHERDRTVLDDVAHTAFDTPSKVIHGIERHIRQRAASASEAFRQLAEDAQRAVRGARALSQALEQQVHDTARRQVRDARAGSQVQMSRVREGALRSVRGAAEGVVQARSTVEQRAHAAVEAVKAQLPRHLAEVQGSARRALQDVRQGSQALMREIAGQGPEKTLARGFAMVLRPDGTAVTSAAGARQLSPGAGAHIRWHDGTATVSITTAGEDPPPFPSTS